MQIWQGDGNAFQIGIKYFPPAIKLKILLTGLLPAAGLSARFHGVPKFLLPILSSGETLIDLQVQNLMAVCEEVRIGVQEEHFELLKTDIKI